MSHQPGEDIDGEKSVGLQTQTFRHLHKTSVSERFIGSHVEIAQQMTHRHRGFIIQRSLCEIETGELFKQHLYCALRKITDELWRIMALYIFIHLEDLHSLGLKLFLCKLFEPSGFSLIQRIYFWRLDLKESLVDLNITWFVFLNLRKN